MLIQALRCKHHDYFNNFTIPVAAGAGDSNICWGNIFVENENRHKYVHIFLKYLLCVLLNPNYVHSHSYPIRFMEVKRLNFFGSNFHKLGLIYSSL